MGFAAFLRSKTNTVLRNVVSFVVMAVAFRIAENGQFTNAQYLALTGSDVRLLIYLGALLSIPVQLVLHEGAHALAALLFRRRVLRIVLGAGPVLARFPVGGCRVEVRALPWSGMTAYAPALPPGRRGVVAFAGPATNVAVALFAATAVGASPLWLGVLSISIGAVVTNLWPSRVRVSGIQTQTDGATLLNAFAGADPEVTRQSRSLMRTAVDEAMQRAGALQPNSFDFLAAALRDPSSTGGRALERCGLSLRQVRVLSSVGARDPRSTAIDAAALIDRADPWTMLQRLLARPEVAEALPPIVGDPAQVRWLAQGQWPDRRIPSGPLPLLMAADLPLERLSAEAVAALRAALHIDARQGATSASLMRALARDRSCVAARVLTGLGIIGAAAAGGAAGRAQPAPVGRGLASAACLGLTSPVFATRELVGTEALLIGVWLYDEDGIASRLEGRGISFIDVVRALHAQLSATPHEAACEEPPARAVRWLSELRALARLHSGRSSEARSDFLNLADCAPDVRALAMSLNNAAWSGLMSDDAELRQDALRLSMRATELMPDHDALRGTRALALIENGMARDGVALLARRLRDAAPERAALQRCVVAIGLAKMGLAADAQRVLDEAKRMDPHAVLLPRAAAAIAA